MYKIIILFSFLLLFISCKETEYKKKLIFYTDSTFKRKRDSVFADSFSEIKQKSFVQIYNRKGDQSFEQGTLNKGIKVGIWKSYLEMLDQVILHEEKIYSQEGDLRNFKAYNYDTQKITEDKNYLYDHLVGIQKEFYPNGNLHISFETDEEGNYINDFIVLSENGKEIFVSHLGKQGTGGVKYYDKNNNLVWEGSFKNKKKEGWHYEYVVGYEGDRIDTISTQFQNNQPIK